jgi:cation diffusion facilitator family transporter
MSASSPDRPAPAAGHEHDRRPDHDDHDHAADDHDHGEHGHEHGEHDHAHDDHSDHNHAEHGHEHGEHDHDHGGGLGGLLAGIFHTHGHSEQRLQRASDPALATAEGIRTIWLALAALSVTTVLQLAIVFISGSVALLADTVHNLGDALNSLPLLVAFYLARRAATRRYTYGFGKAEDIAGIVIVLSILVSAGVIFWESGSKLLSPTPILQPWWVAAASVIGFIGNEAVAMLQIRTGKRIGSAAMVADGLHARTDGLTSLAVLVAVGGSVLGFPIVDPIIGLLIGVTILFIARDAITTMWYRLMDAIDPELVDRIEREAAQVPGIQLVRDVRVRWMGHQLQAELHIVVDEDLPTRASHELAEEVRHRLLHDQPHLSTVTVHVDPCGHSGTDPHAALAHHAPGRMPSG